MGGSLSKRGVSFGDLVRIQMVLDLIIRERELECMNSTAAQNLRYLFKQDCCMFVFVPLSG